MDRIRVIGRAGGLPWRIGADLKRFKALTMGHHIIMGRKTYESIGRLLPGRTSVIVTRRSRYPVPGGIIAHSLDEALARSGADTEVFVIGGSELYREALPLADRLYITEVDGSFDGDTWFPKLDACAWREISREHIGVPGPGYNGFAFVVLERTAPARGDAPG